MRGRTRISLAFVALAAAPVVAGPAEGQSDGAVELERVVRHGGPVPDGLPPALARPIAELESRLAADVAEDGVGSLAAAVFIGDRIVWEAAFGVGDRVTRALASPGAIYRAGSLGKPITALTLMALVERRVVTLDDPVAPHLPELRHLANLGTHGVDITFRHLATHTAGLAREPAASAAGRGPYSAWRDRLIAAIPSTEVVAGPGEGYLYSNIGYALLGLAMERAAGRPYEELVRELVLEPLDMRSTWFVVPRSERRRLVTGYVNLPGDTADPRVPRAEHRGRGYRSPSDGIYSTPGDLARLGMAMTGALGDAPIRASTRGEVLTDQTGAAAARSAGTPRPGYGLGFQLHRLGSTVIAGHSGAVPGYTAYVALDPATGVGVVLLRSYNHGTTNLGATAMALVLELAAAES